MNPQLVARIRQCPNLPTLPTIAVQVLDFAQRPDADIAEIARLISKDPALAGKILRTVNSSFYARSQPVATISHALVMLGLQSVRTLVLGFSLVTNLSKSKPNGFKHLDYWKRSIYSATAARALSARVGLVQQEETFLASLLTDIGMLVLDQVLGPEYGEVTARAASHEELTAVETAQLDLSHGDAGGILASQWKLPPLLVTPITHHHSPERVTDPQLRRFTEIVQLSGRCADIFIDEQPAAAIASVRKLCQDQHGITGDETDALMSEIGRKTREVAGLFELSIGAAADYETVLRKANEALVEITLHSQQQAAVLVQQAVSLQQKASQLTVQNQQLEARANTDALTGLANRSRFDAFFADAFDSASRDGKPLSLLLLDVDRFKSVNDRLGHPAGDLVLKALAKMLGNATRAGDLAARYGGEEMVLVLPGTTRATAAAIAESIRRTVAAKPIYVGETQLPITVSIGMASLEPGTALAAAMTSPVHLLKAADLAVYAAKRSGRNCVRIFSMNKPAAPAAEAAAPAAPALPLPIGAVA
jgi:diguanylate cyclase (GGDEF)-like protein